MEAHAFTQDPPATSATGTFTTYEKPEPIVLPRFGQWPTFYVGQRGLRNGREAGAYFLGILDFLPEKCAHVVLTEEFAPGAVHVMVDGGLVVKSYSSRDDERTFEVRSQHYEFVEPSD